MRAFLLATAMISFPAIASAGVIERACLTSDRSVADRALCTCIQQAADRTLSARDQRLAARFFRDPDRAQRVRMSNRRSDEAFWERYESFGAFAQVVCARS